LPSEKFPVSLDKFIFICLGYTEITPDEKVREARLYETVSDWTRNYCNDSLLEHFKAYCDDSKAVKKQQRD
jgi:hypothetical protein